MDHIQLPPPPPREYVDGKPRVYRLNYRAWDHGFTWERWRFRPAGVFHAIYHGEFAQELPPFRAWLFNRHVAAAVVPYVAVLLTIAVGIHALPSIGVYPKRFTQDWIEAARERDRAENANPITRYLDRRYRERGPQWFLKDIAWHSTYTSVRKGLYEKDYQKIVDARKAS